jgi:hypothetical protein
MAPDVTEYSMRSMLLALTLGSTLVASSAAIGAQSMTATTMPSGAPIGHLQPRAQQFAPDSTAEQAQQEEMSNFDAQQHKLDEELDKHLRAKVTSSLEDGLKGNDGRAHFEEILK